MENQVETQNQVIQNNQISVSQKIRDIFANISALDLINVSQSGATGGSVYPPIEEVDTSLLEENSKSA